MTLIAESGALAAFCRRQHPAEFVAIDTEFMRDKTYWPQLCLVQVAGPEEAAAIDTLAPGIDLDPLLGLLADSKLLKVFHAARQDIEIFYHMTKRIPAPLVDTQVAAMVCGFGDAVSYENLAAKLAGARIDKSSRFTDWAHRPLTDPATYRLEPRQAWRRIKFRTDKPRMLAVLREVAAWREEEAQRRDLPRNRVLRDETLCEIAAHAPTDVEHLARCRGLSRSIAENRQGAQILAAVKRGLELPAGECPEPTPRRDLPSGLGPLIELLRVLLKMRCEENGVAQKLIASADDLELIAADDGAEVPALHGWRREIFGADALALKHGRLALTVVGRRVKVVPVPAG